MKNALLALGVLFLFQTFAYAAFPVKVKDANEKTKIEMTEFDGSSALIIENQILDNDLMLPSGGGPGFGIASLACGFLGLFISPLLLGICAIVFGALGLGKDLNGLAIAGLCLGIIDTLFILLLLAILI